MNIFRARVEHILLYGSETRTLSAKLHRWFEGTFTKLLRRAQNIYCKDYASLNEINGSINPASQRQRRAQFAVNCHRATNGLYSLTRLWKSKPLGNRSRKLTFPDINCRDTGLSLENLPVAISDRHVWSEIMKSISAAAQLNNDDDNELSLLSFLCKTLCS